MRIGFNQDSKMNIEQQMEKKDAKMNIEQQTKKKAHEGDSLLENTLFLNIYRRCQIFLTSSQAIFFNVLNPFMRFVESPKITYQ